MHSSRMRTVRFLTVSQHALPGVYLPSGVPARGVPAREVYLPRGYLPRYSPVNRMTERCKNITLPQTSFAGGKNSSLSGHHQWRI